MVVFGVVLCLTMSYVTGGAYYLIVRSRWATLLPWLGVVGEPDRT